MKKGKLPPFAFDAGSIFIQNAAINRKPAAAAAAAAATSSSKVPPPPLLCVLWHFLCAKSGYFQALSDLTFRRLTSPQVLMLPLSGVFQAYFCCLFQASFRRAASFRPLSGLFQASHFFQAYFCCLFQAFFRPLSASFRRAASFRRHISISETQCPGGKHMAKENTPANALLLHVCPHTAYCSACVRIPGTNCRR
jgi:hypothetical protein